VPRYPFGHGLGYTRWEYLSADCRTPETDAPLPVPGPAFDDAYAVVRVRLRNAGTRHGRETVQVYASRPGSAIERPARWLAGFTRTEASPGTEVTASIPVPLRQLAHWDTAARGWVVEPGTYRLHIGRSSSDLPLTADLTISAGPEGGDPDAYRRPPR
jgi:beta-glucosidase